MGVDAVSSLRANARRVREIASVLAKYGLAEGLRWLDVDFVQDRMRSVNGDRLREQPFVARVRLALTELGCTFQKMGQTLGTRPDLCGDELANELAKLQVRTVADGPEEVVRRIEAELGAKPSELFAWFDPTPLASASIAQVHAARTHDGEEVVVKLVRSGVEAQARVDLDILAAVARIAELRSPSLRAWQPTLVARQLRRSLLRELDMQHERANMERFAAAFAQDGSVRFPHAKEGLCSRGALTMERFRGTPISDAAALHDRAADQRAIARIGAKAWLDMVFRDGFFHADPHPGNLLWLEDGVLGILDCGMAARIDPMLREQLEDLMLLAVDRRSSDLADCLLQICRGEQRADREALGADLAEILDDHIDTPLQRVEIGEFLGAVFGVLHRHRLALPASLAMLLRTVVVLEGSSRMLDRSFSLAQIAAPACRRAVRMRWAPRRVAVRVMRASREWERLVAAFPSGLRRTIERMGHGSFRVRLEHRHLDDSVNRLTLGILTAALVLASASLWASAAPPRIGNVSALGLAGFTAAAMLGIRLWRSSRRALSDRGD
jgi:ubiquinone biosynthesis protein